jgi:PAS domain S-box-containing protein
MSSSTEHEKPSSPSARTPTDPPSSAANDRDEPPSTPLPSTSLHNFDLQDTETLFQAYLETASDMVYTVDLEGRLTFINRYGQHLLGCDQGEWYRRPYMSFVAPESQEATAAAFASLLQTGELKDYEFMIQPLKGNPVCMEVNGRVLFRKGQPIGGLGIARDITERKRSEQRLQMFLQAIESSYDSAMIVDLDGTIVYANSATARTFGYDVEAMLGQNASIFYPPQAELSIEDLIERALGDSHDDGLGDVAGWSGETICQRQTQAQLFPAIISVSPIPSDRGRPTMVSITCRDITTQKAIQAELASKNLELEQASRHKSSFLASMSHELRTPLTSILGFSSLLIQGLFGDLNEKQQSYVQGIEDSGLHLLELIKDILDLSKIEAGKIELDFAPCSLVGICGETIGLVSSQARKKQIEIQLEIMPGLDTIEADELRLRQMLLNLLSNALKFSESGSQIGVEAKLHEGAIHLSVWDHGIGIAEENLDLLFQPFQQIDNSLSRNHEGTGLGLALTNQFAHLHGGFVTCESQLGAGSRFTIVLPDLRPSPIDTPNQSPHPEPTIASPAGTIDHRDALILIVEDDPSNATFLQDAIQHWGYQVYHASDGLEALDWLTSHTPDLILMDVNLPDLNGLDVTRQLKLTPDRQHIPIMAMTALVMVGDRERCLAAGMQDYISKPINSDRLAAILERYLRISLT